MSDGVEEGGTSAAKNRRCPPGVRTARIRPASARRLTVLLATRNNAATWLVMSSPGARGSVLVVIIETSFEPVQHQRASRRLPTAASDRDRVAATALDGRAAEGWARAG